MTYYFQNMLVIIIKVYYFCHLMMLCSCLFLPEGQQLFLHLSQEPCLTLCLINYQNQRCLISKLTPSSIPKPLLLIFSSLEELYKDLIQKDSDIIISDESQNLTLKYQMSSILGDHIVRTIDLPTKILIQSKSQLHHSKSQDSIHHLKLNRNFGSQREFVSDVESKIYCDANKQEMANKITPLKDHPGWFYNTQPIFLTLGKLQQNHSRQQIITHHINFNFKRYHSQKEQTINRYDLTLGIAHPKFFPQLKQSPLQKFDSHLNNTISINVRKRSITCRCFDLEERLDFQKTAQPQSLQLYITRKRSKETLITTCIEMFINQHILINVWKEEKLVQFQENLVKLQDFMSFVRLERSYLHFSLNNNHSRRIILT